MFLCVDLCPVDFVSNYTLSKLRNLGFFVPGLQKVKNSHTRQILSLKEETAINFTSSLQWGVPFENPVRNDPRWIVSSFQAHSVRSSSSLTHLYFRSEGCMKRSPCPCPHWLWSPDWRKICVREWRSRSWVLTRAVGLCRHGLTSLSHSQVSAHSPPTTLASCHSSNKHGICPHRGCSTEASHVLPVKDHKYPPAASEPCSLLPLWCLLQSHFTLSWLLSCHSTHFPIPGLFSFMALITTWQWMLFVYCLSELTTLLVPQGQADLFTAESPAASTAHSRQSKNLAEWILERW